MTMPTLPPGLDKPGLRAWARVHRLRAARAAGLDHAERLAAVFLARVPLRAHETVAGFFPVHGEADPLPLMLALAKRGHTLALPYVRRKAAPLGFRRWRPGEPLAIGAFGIPEPHPRLAETVPSVVLVPGLWFDPAGGRLGYGGGFYDRTLAALRRGRRVRAVGIAYAGQVGPGLPLAAHDVPMDFIVTGRGVVRVRAA